MWVGAFLNRHLWPTLFLTNLVNDEVVVNMRHRAAIRCRLLVSGDSRRFIPLTQKRSPFSPPCLQLPTQHSRLELGGNACGVSYSKIVRRSLLTPFTYSHSSGQQPMAGCPIKRWMRASLSIREFRTLSISKEGWECSRDCIQWPYLVRF